MLIKFFRNGQGGGAGPVDYLIDREVVAYDANRNRIIADDGLPAMIQRDPLPEVLQGDPERMRQLIDSCPHQWSYRAGVIAFAAEDSPTHAQQREVMDRFGQLAFAGLEGNNHDILWVRHSHEGRVELHFVTPRMELVTGKSLNIAPPGYHKTYDALRDCLNKEHGWSDPQAPERARDVVSLIETVRRGNAREQIHDWLLDRIEAGTITDRASMITALQEAGFSIPRAGKTYLTVMDPQSGQPPQEGDSPAEKTKPARWRLKGDIFREDWTRQDTLERAAAGTAAGADRQPDPSGSRLAGYSLDELQDRLREVTERRESYNRQRYAQAVGREPDIGPDRITTVEISGDAGGHDRPCREPAGNGRELVLGNGPDRPGTARQSLADGPDPQPEQQRRGSDVGRTQGGAGHLSFSQRTKALFEAVKRRLSHEPVRKDTAGYADTIGARLDGLSERLGQSIRSLGDALNRDDLSPAGPAGRLAGFAVRFSGLLDRGIERLREQVGTGRFGRSATQHGADTDRPRLSGQRGKSLTGKEELTATRSAAGRKTDSTATGKAPSRGF